MITPTIGIEIELPWRTMLHRVDEEAAELLAQRHNYYAMNQAEQSRMKSAFDTLDEQYKDTVHSVFGDKIARGSDGYVEFALRPQHDYRELIEVVDELYDKGILRSGETYPLHITLGHISRTAGAWAVLTAVELAGGATPERIEERRSWSRKGEAGILERQPHEMQLGVTRGVELRSLVVDGQARLGQALMVAQDAGSMLLAHLDQGGFASTRWGDFKSHLTESLEEKMTHVRRRWPNPQVDSMPWHSLANAMRDEDWSIKVESGILGRLMDIRAE